MKKLIKNLIMFWIYAINVTFPLSLREQGARRRIPASAYLSRQVVLSGTQFLCLMKAQNGTFHKLPKW